MSTEHLLRVKLDREVEVLVSAAVIAGWTGRDRAALEKHIIELEALGVARPSSTPIFYRVSASRLTTSSRIQVTGGRSSGEVEFVILKRGERLWVGVGSDHTDREAETYNVTVSKQMCEKPVAPEFWDFSDVSGHWDRLMLRSFIQEDGKRKLYQEGPVAAMLTPQDLLARWNAPFEDGSVMFGGTLAAQGGIRPSERFEFEIEDPVRQRRIAHGYDIVNLPVAG